MAKFLRGEALFPGSNLILVDPNGTKDSDGTEAAPLGEGASGKVYRAVQDDLLDRAVKILSPTPELIAKLGLEELQKVFEREKLKLSKLTHSNIAKLISFGIIPDSDTPYLVMDFVAGRKLHEILALPDAILHLKPEDLVSLLGDVLAALQYMHERRSMHGDVKEANIIVRHTDRHEAILVDLGCAHIFDDDGAEVTDYNSTKSRNPLDWQDRINKPIQKKLLAENRIKLDLYMFGQMLRLLIGNWDRSEDKEYAWQTPAIATLRQLLADTGLVVLARIAQRCCNFDYDTAAEARRDLQRLLPGYVSPLGIPELSLGSDAATSVSLPKGRVFLTPSLRNIINHPLMQRLQDISQLDRLRLVYPGASHSRFLHSLESFDLARSYLGALLADPMFRAYGAEKEATQAALLGALLHDIGHYPLEHVLEDFEAKRDPTANYSEVMSDDKVTGILLGAVKPGDNEFVSEAASTLLQNISSRRRAPIPSLRDLISGTKDFGERTYQRLCSLFTAATPLDPGLAILRSIIDGPIDVDKVAYLRTDAYMTGAQYGNGIDLDALLGSLTCVTGSPVIGASLAIRTKGICAAEAIATGRRWMFQRVYWHRTNRAMMAMLRYPLHVLFHHGALRFPEYFSATFAMSEVEAVKWVDGKFADLRRRAGIDIDNPALCLIEGARIPYKLLLELPASQDKTLEKARQFLMSRTCEQWYKTSVDVAKLIRKHVPATKDSDVLIDLPIKARWSMDDVAVVGLQTEPVRLSTISPEYRSVQEFFQAGALVCRIFVNASIRPEVIARREQLEGDILTMLAK